MEKALHYKDFSENNISDWVNILFNKFINSRKKEIVICCIGTDKAIFDCIGCLTGEFSQKNNLKNIKIYGTLEHPIHALNIDSKMKLIYTKHPDSFIIGVDACLGDKDELGIIKLRDIPVSPGKGIGKDLSKIGDMSIVGISNNRDNIFAENKTRLFTIFNMSLIISDIIKKLDEKIDNSIKIKDCNNCFWKFCVGEWCMHENFKPLNNVCNKHTFRCSVCGDREALYEYNNENICYACLLEEFNVKKEITVNYYLDDKYLGSNKNIDDVILNLDCNIKKI